MPISLAEIEAVMSQLGWKEDLTLGMFSIWIHPNFPNDGIMTDHHEDATQVSLFNIVRQLMDRHGGQDYLFRLSLEWLKSFQQNSIVSSENQIWEQVKE